MNWAVQCFRDCISRILRFSQFDFPALKHSYLMKLWNNTLRSSTWSHLFSLFTSDWKEILLNILRRNPNLSNKCTYTLYRGYSYQIANLCVTVKYFLKRHHFFNNAKCRKTNFEGHVYVLWVIDQACSVNMAGYWPSSFFACLSMDRDEVGVHKHAKEKKEADIQSAWPNMHV